MKKKQICGNIILAIYCGACAVPLATSGGDSRQDSRL